MIKLGSLRGENGGDGRVFAVLLSAGLNLYQMSGGKHGQFIRQTTIH